MTAADSTWSSTVLPLGERHSAATQPQSSPCHAMANRKGAQQIQTGLRWPPLRDAKRRRTRSYSATVPSASLCSARRWEAARSPPQAARPACSQAAATACSALVDAAVGRVQRATALNRRQADDPAFELVLDLADAAGPSMLPFCA
ncbi:unnamed protein product [Symbiodinium sp. KB8]|nr:unnamed protein product [Symbiodinium sp. KB8]